MPNYVPLDDFSKAVARIGQLETALRELEGFAARNVERAKKAAEAAETASKVHGSFIIDTVHKELLEAAARYHDAHRFHLVVRDRVREALAP